MSDVQTGTSWARLADDEWWDLDATSRRVGRYVWLERRLFSLLGEWVGRASSDELRVELARQSRERGDLATAWLAQLPAHVAADHAALIDAPDSVSSFLDDLERMTHRDDAAAVVTLRDRLLAAQLDALDRHLAVARPISDAPVIEVLRRARSMASAHREAWSGISGGVAGTPEQLGDPEWSLVGDL